MYGIIYKTTYLPTGEWYVGQHKCTTDEFDGYLGSGKIIKDFLRTHDADKFERITLAIAETKEDLNNLEIFYIDALDCLNDPHCWNISTGGESVNLPDDYYDTPDGLVARQRISEGIKNYYKTDEGKENLLRHAEHVKARYQTEEGKKSLERQNQKRKDWWASPAGEAQRQEWREHPRKGHIRKVMCIETGEIFNSSAEAGRKYGLSHSTINNVCRGIQKTAANGLHWKYADEGGGC